MAIENPDLLISLGRLSHFKNSLAPVAVTGSYDDLTGKPDIPTVPTAVSAFTNDSGYITEAQAAEAAKLKKTIVVELPDAEDADENTLYLILAEDGGGSDIYDEYMLIDGSMEKIGSTRIDLTGYLTEDDLATDGDIDGLFAAE
jgi:hypothetical protein